jgi:hypothetical protein
MIIGGRGRGVVGDDDVEAILVVVVVVVVVVVEDGNGMVEESRFWWRWRWRMVHQAPTTQELQVHCTQRRLNPDRKGHVELITNIMGDHMTRVTFESR